MRHQDREKPVATASAAILLGAPGKPWGHTRMSAIKRCMGLQKVRYIFVSEVLSWLVKNPNFSEMSVYKRDVVAPVSARVRAAAAASASLLGLAVKQGYVPRTCLLRGALVLAEIKAGRNPCWGCASHRENCDGQTPVKPLT